MRGRIDAHVHSCDACQRYKDQGRGQGALPPRQDVSTPFEEIAADLIGPWSIDINGQTLQIQALTIADIATTLAEIVRIEDQSSQHVANLFDNSWLACYPRPLRCIFNQGGEFNGRPFQSMLIQKRNSAGSHNCEEPSSQRSVQMYALHDQRFVTHHLPF
jgi:hypothetical protein